MKVNKPKTTTTKSSNVNSSRFAPQAATTPADVISEFNNNNNKIMYTDRDNNHSFVMNMMYKKDSLKKLVNDENPNWNALKSIYQ